MHRKVLLIVAGMIAVASLPSVASADWQYTRWGMTVSEVETASKGIAKPNRNRDLDESGGPMRTELVAPYQASGMPFQAQFQFKQNRLTGVNLKGLDNGQCHKLAGSLSNTYGSPHDQSNSSITTLKKWWDRTNGNVVIYLTVGESCYLSYQGFGQAGAPGGL